MTEDLHEVEGHQEPNSHLVQNIRLVQSSHLVHHLSPLLRQTINGTLIWASGKNRYFSPG